VLHKLGRRALDLVIGLFAVLGFFYVPLGAKTGFEHVKAIVATAPAVEGYRGFVSATEKLHRTLVDTLQGRRPRRPANPSARNASTEEPKTRAEQLSHVMPADAGADVSVVAPGS
jgi:hypothetical protein